MNLPADRKMRIQKREQVMSYTHSLRSQKSHLPLDPGLRKVRTGPDKKHPVRAMFFPFLMLIVLVGLAALKHHG